MRKSMSLRLRLLLLILSPVLLVSVLLGVWRFQTAQTTAEALFDRGLLAVALAISRDVAISGGDALSPRTRALMSDAGGGEVFYHVTGPGGIYVTGYAYPPTPERADPSGAPLFFVATYRSEDVRVLRMSEVSSVDELTGPSVVTVWQRASDRNALAFTLAWRATAVLAALMATLALVIWFGVQLGLRPLRDLQDAIKRRSPDDLSRIQRAVPEEVSGIVATLNHLLGQVDSSIRAHQAFISDAAHQLRNPASALLSLAETLPSVTDPEERRERHQDLISAARKSARLAEQLLSLERLRYEGPQRLHPLDLTELARSVCSDLGPDILSRDLAFDFTASPDPLPVKADPVLLAEALSNLLDNAVQHGGPDLSRISVSTWRAAGLAMVSVNDDGQGLAPEDADTAFRRFGQVHAGDGSGLGLSIADEVARGHGGRLWLEPVAKGTRIVFAVPLRA